MKNVNNLDNAMCMQETTFGTHLLLNRCNASHTKKICGNNAWSTYLKSVTPLMLSKRQLLHQFFNYIK